MNISRNKTICAVAVTLAASFLFVSRADRAAIGDDQASADALKQAQIEYAKAVLKSAQTNLARAREVNSRAADTIPAPAIRNLESDVTAAEARVKSLQGASSGDGDGPYLMAAKSALAIAEGSLKEAQDINARVPGAVGKSDVDRRQADVDLARARLRVAQLLNTAPPMERMQWELMQLQEEVNSLQYKVQTLQYRN